MHTGKIRLVNTLSEASYLTKDQWYPVKFDHLPTLNERFTVSSGLFGYMTTSVVREIRSESDGVYRLKTRNSIYEIVDQLANFP